MKLYPVLLRAWRLERDSVPTISRFRQVFHSNVLFEGLDSGVEGGDFGFVVFPAGDL